MDTKVLIVDDSYMVRQMVTRSLVDAGFVVVEAKDGADGLEKLAENADIALVICDVNMPCMNGLEFLTRVRQDPRWSTLAVVMLTTEAQPELVHQAKSLDAKGWMVKPFKPELLVAATRRLLAPRAA